MPPHGRANAGDLAALFVDSLPLIDRILRAIAARYRLEASEAEEFGSIVREKLIGNGYAILARFEGRSSLGTWLTVVLVNLFRDHRNELWGRWRPSKTARNLGAVATQLETLIYRDGHSVQEAVTILRARDPLLDERMLRGLHRQLPARLKVREVGFDQVPVADLASEAEVFGSLEAGDREKAVNVLRAVLEALPAEDQVIIRMRYWDGLTVADIARLLGLEQPRLYPRLRALHGLLRERLREAGLTERLAAECFGAEPDAGRPN